ncbi:hypothetical protein ABD80_08795 [Bacillus atrophaeus]|uniref:Uncharacterized protein n=1 Tax=Bacillus atrophaeus (strain 1942) TaxID=720555 RepID=A0ABM5M317_BACA1|nr:hypothetical protein BATR1942_18030 [Bacillus atrophaeus 1942]AMR64587.1 hypothetical protein A1D11_20310 [Bacillus subtilis subsp. globigii]EIM11435.1 hypothetical protein UY9_06785 [Bacillus atrophaeus C89]MBG9759914.1 hypothetical protein [Bacillus atrophaeus]MDR4398373.1 hypothetical protein [Bacillus atrophaeus]
MGFFIRNGHEEYVTKAGKSDFEKVQFASFFKFMAVKKISLPTSFRQRHVQSFFHIFKYGESDQTAFSHPNITSN